MVKTITAGVMMNEKQALLMFSWPKGEVDMGQCFCSGSDQFHEWCADYFDYMWKQSRLFDSKMLVEVYRRKPMIELFSLLVDWASYSGKLVG